MNFSPWMLTALIVGTSGLSAPALATPRALQTKPQTMADALAVEHHSPDHLNRLAGQLGQRVGRRDSVAGSTIADQIPFLDDLIGNFLDEAGEFKLPLGLTVYDAMGTTSVGLSGRF
jgi:hypothetical protein